MHWVKDCKSKFDIEGKPILGNSKQGTPSHPAPRPGPLQQKPGANSIFSLKPSTSSSAAVHTPGLHDLLLCLQPSPLEYLLDFLDPCLHKPSVFYLADLV